MAESVGAIQLDLVLEDTIGKQVEKAASAGRKQAEKAFSQAGRSMEQALSGPVEAAMDKAGRALEKAADFQAPAPAVDFRQLREEQARIQAEMDAITDSMEKSKQEAAGFKIPEEGLETLSVMTDEVQLLRACIANTHDKMEETARELQKYQAILAGMPDEDVGGEQFDAVCRKITDLEGRFLSYNKTLMANQNKLDKALDGGGAAGRTASALEAAEQKVKAVQEKAAAAVKAAQDKAAAAVEAANAKIGASSGKASQKARAAFQKAGAGIGSAFKKAGAAVGRQFKGIQQKAGGLARSVQSAFKSAFLMAGLYAAFRGVKSLIGGAVGQNEEFAASLNLIKANLLTAFTPVMQAIQPALNALAGGFAAISRQIAAATAGLFGQTYAQAAAATRKMQGVSKEAEKASGSLAGIDEINTLGSGGSGGADSGTDLEALDTAQYEDAAGFGQRVTDMLAGLAAQIGPAVAAILTRLAEAAPQFVEGAALVITSLLSGFNANAPQIMEAGLGILQSLLDGLKSVLPELGPFVTNVITLLLEAFMAYGPQLLAMGVTLLQNVLAGLADKMPELIPMAKEAIRTVMDALTENLPLILQAGMDILMEIVRGISDMLPELIPAAVECILALVQGLLDNLPELIDAAIDLIVALAFGIIDALPVLLEKAPEIIKTLVDGIVDSIPMLIDAAIDLIMKLVDFLVDNLDLILPMGLKIVMALADGLIKAIPDLVMAAPKLVKSLIDKIMNTDWGKVGMDILSGIGNGLVEGVKNIGSTIKKAASGLLDGFKGFFGIHSPSRLFRDEIGENLALGIGEGFEEEMDVVGRRMGSLVPSVTAAVAAPALDMVEKGNGSAAYAAGAASAPADTHGEYGLQAAALELLQEIAGLLRGGMRLEVEGNGFASALRPFLQALDRRAGGSVVRVV